jgi:lipid-binding SYLF domain-containing protein
MRRARALALSALAAGLVLAGSVGAAVLRSADAQETHATLWVTGLRIDGAKARAVVRLTNTSNDGHDLFAVHYTIQAGNAGEPLSQLAAGPTGAVLGKGRTLDLDLGDIVTKYRASLGIGPYAGFVRLVAYADSSGRPFGRDVVQVSATQSERNVVYEPSIEWR